MSANGRIHMLLRSMRRAGRAFAFGCAVDAERLAYPIPKICMTSSATVSTVTMPTVTQMRMRVMMVL